jgi:hypothetical protein
MDKDSPRGVWRSIYPMRTLCPRCCNGVVSSSTEYAKHIESKLTFADLYVSEDVAVRTTGQGVWSKEAWRALGARWANSPIFPVCRI